MARNYLPRIADEVLDFKLSSKGAVWIRGPKWCGKSTTAERHSKSVVRMQDEGTKEQNRSLARLSPSVFLDEPPPFLIDEWQEIPFIWNQVRVEIDRRDEFGQFILTGSVQPDELELEVQHSGIGRITDLLMRPMSLFESGESTGAISLEKLFSGDDVSATKCSASIFDYAFFTARGGWPKAIGLNERVALQQAIDYYEGIVKGEIKLPDGVNRDPDRVRLLLRSYARNCGSQANNSTLRRDMTANDVSSLNEDTIHSYVSALKRLYVIEESEAWNPNLRSKTAIRTSNTRYFMDPSIGCAALGVGPKGLISDLNTFGFLFENLCVRDLRIYMDRIGGSVKHFRTSDGLECDAVLILRDGTWAAVEVKLGDPDRIEEGVENLKSLVGKLDPRMKAPTFLMVLTTTNVAYRREDGVWVVPLASLGP